MLFVALLARATDAPAQQTDSGGAPPTFSDSLQSAYRLGLSRLSSPELEERTARRRALQQQGYAEILHEIQAGDGLAALMSWVRMVLQLEYSIPRYPLFVYVRGPATRADSTLSGLLSPASASPVALRLTEDRSFPVNPWTPEQNRKRP